MNKGTKLKKIRKVGFINRMGTQNGRKIINSKRKKKRQKLIR
uniref:Ribosomal protein L34 n=1 Tax=Chondria tumulosa TaxID=2740715 RepID=A0A896SPM6_9FLOR|nr:ribosomal protein L34 [Chondria tumulosa]QSD57012.1 ribosomal protein L34 [Chondria tumulosa]